MGRCLGGAGGDGDGERVGLVGGRIGTDGGRIGLHGARVWFKGSRAGLTRGKAGLLELLCRLGFLRLGSLWPI